MVWFSKSKSVKQQALPKDAINFIDKHMGPIHRLAGLGEAIAAYNRAVKKGKLTSPAYKRQDSIESLAYIWRDTRLEVMSNLWRCGPAEIFAEITKPVAQLKLLESFVQEKPHLEFPHQLNGIPSHDIWQGIFQIYLHMDGISKALGDLMSTEGVKKTLTLKEILQNADGKQKKATIFSDFENQANMLLIQWRNYSDWTTERPLTIFDILFDDVTNKSKVIALGAVFGPYYLENIKDFRLLLSDNLKSNGISDEKINLALNDYDKTVNEFLAAKDCDDLIVSFPVK